MKKALSSIFAVFILPAFVCLAQNNVSIEAADSLYRHGKFEEAVAMASRIQVKAIASADTTTLVQALCICADASIELGDDATAIEMYNLCSDITGLVEPMFMLSSSLYNIATIYYENGEYDKAEEYVEKSINMDAKRSSDSIHALRYLLAAQICYENGDYDKALDMAKKGHECTIRRKNMNVDGRLKLVEAKCFEAMEGDKPIHLDIVEKAYEDACHSISFTYPGLYYSKPNPYLAEARYHLALLEKRQGKYDEAKKNFQEALENAETKQIMRGINPAVALHTCREMALILKEEGDNEGAARYEAKADSLAFVPYMQEMFTKLSLSQMEFIRREKDLQIERQTYRSRILLTGAIFLSVAVLLLLFMLLKQIKLRKDVEQKSAQLVKLSLQKDKLINIIKSDDSSKAVIPEDISQDTAFPEISLSKREKEVTTLCCKGLTNKEIAAALNVSVRTVETHKLNICRKLGVNTTAELVAFAYKCGWSN